MNKVPPITRGRKFSQVLEGARTIFLRDGFEGASVDDIAREAGVSKATLYSYFPDKRLMFIEVFRTELEREMSDAGALINIDLPMRQVLPFVVQMISRHLVTEFGVRVFRLALAEAERFPELAREYYETGPLRLRHQLADYFRRCIARGELRIDDCELAADQLIRLASADIHDRASFLGPDAVDEAAITRATDGALRLFLTAYAVEPAALKKISAAE